MGSCSSLPHPVLPPPPLLPPPPYSRRTPARTRAVHARLVRPRPPPPAPAVPCSSPRFIPPPHLALLHVRLP
uniref:Uncharacterized protein n=1 Tax=Arundo donax TaxID=35708 RepID=A0A0A8XWZ6_ARUDO